MRITSEHRAVLELLQQWDKTPPDSSRFCDFPQFKGAMQIDDDSTAIRLLRAMQDLGVIVVTTDRQNVPYMFRIESGQLEQVLLELEAEAKALPPDRVAWILSWLRGHWGTAIFIILFLAVTALTVVLSFVNAIFDLIDHLKNLSK